MKLFGYELIKTSTHDLLIKQIIKLSIENALLKALNDIKANKKTKCK